MKKVIYSIYVNIPAKEHYGKSKNKYDTVEKAFITVNSFRIHYDKLIETKLKYSKHCDADFLMFEYDDQYKIFENNLLNDCPNLTGYEVINFYKIHLLYELSKKYDEILYLDFDAVPLTNESFFEAWDLSKGICVYNNNDQVVKNKNINHSIRSPSAKYFNCQAMLLENGFSPKNDVINTGIIGANKEHIIKLNYFDNFNNIIKLMTRLKDNKHDIYPQNILDMFRYDNETIFSYKSIINDVKLQWLDNKWHYFFDTQKFIPDDTKIVHCICKDFDAVWRNYD